MLIWEDKVFKILQGKRGYVLIRKDSEYGYHAHFDSINGCKTLITLYYKKKIPYSQYYRVAMERITSTEEREFFTEQRPKEKCRKR